MSSSMDVGDFRHSQDAKRKPCPKSKSGKHMWERKIGGPSWMDKCKKCGDLEYGK